MYGGKNTLIRASAGRREACQPGCKFLEKPVFREKINKNPPPSSLEDGENPVLPLQFAAPSQKAALWGTNCIPACCNGQTRRALTSMLGRDSGNSKAGSPAGPYSPPPGRMLAPAAYSLRPGMDGTHPANCFPPAPAGKADGHRLFTIYLYFSMERAGCQPSGPPIYSPSAGKSKE